MKLDHYKPAKNNLLLREVLVEATGEIILHEKTSAGYYEVVKVGPLAENTKPGDHILTTLQQGVEVEFEEGVLLQLPEYGVEGYYFPTKDELKAPKPIFKQEEVSDEESLNIIDSEGGNNELGSELGLRED